MTTETKNTLGNFFKALLIADIGWAAILATLQSLFLGQAGVSIGANGVATSVAVGASWISTFVIGLFQGAILLFFILLLLGLWVGAYHFFTKTLDNVAKVAIGRVFLAIGAVDVLWAVIQGVYAAAVVAGIGTATAVSASTPVVVAASLLSFIVSFTIGLFTGGVVLTILAVFTLVIGTIVSMIRNR